MLLKLTRAALNKRQIISNSPWSDRLFCFHAGLDEFVEEPEDEYDLIVPTLHFIPKITKRITSSV
jgi:hypothetical protein